MRRFRLPLLRAGLAGACAVTGAVLATPADARRDDAPDRIVMTDVLVLPPVGTGGRRPFPTDAVEAALAQGTWSPPALGAEVVAPDGTRESWFGAATNEDEWLTGRALRGGWVHWTVESDRERVMILAASGHSVARVNGVPRAGDPYANGWPRLPVVLRAGTNEILFHVQRGRVRAALDAPKADAFLELREATLPDLIVGEPGSWQGAVVVVNATREPMTDLFVNTHVAGLRPMRTALPRIEPLSVRKVAITIGELQFEPGPDGPNELSLGLELGRGTGPTQTEILDRGRVGLALRRPGERHRRTFTSAIDGSVQSYAVTPASAPVVPAADAAPGLILTLHGASVEAFGQARVYAPRDWAHVVAPTNRRPFGFDWEDWGRLDALEVLADASARLEHDPARTWLTGHSMGGHGTWHLGLTFPDRFAAIAPSAGWVSFWSYTGAERFEDASPVEALLLRATSPSDTLALERNALHHGVYVLHGDRDDNVPVEQARTMRERLGTFHPDFAYHEQPGAGHWWGNRCCDWPALMAFLRERSRPAPETVDAVEFRTACPGVSAWSRWVGVEQQHASREHSVVRARLDRGARRFAVETENVRRLALRVGHLGGDGPIEVEIDGTALPAADASPDDGILRFVADTPGAWRAADGPPPADEKTPARAGSFKDAFRHRVALVYGTAGTPEENAWAAAKARFDAETFWYRGNGAFEVLPDTAFDPGADPDRSVVLYGNADTCTAWTALLGQSPVQVGRGGLACGDFIMDGDDLACLFVRPRPGSAVASVGVVAGTGLRGLRATERLPYFVSGVAYPDVTVFRADVLEQGAGGVRGTGFFGPDWSVAAGAWAFSP